ncbi:hypothetical protein [Arthrobacter sp. efr-133-TYG-118]|uniref:hypothetical protein n=1 Tax=Arthrobacter sp. efr-133-TYG-118 TaxID=3040279 RepID=UPI00254A108B|nr:hypothetical protein [Arthrobacter sp. efr-133-TYG-118]
MKRRERERQASIGAGECQLETGRRCPRSGLWSPAGQDAVQVLVFEGKWMPTIGGRAVTWLPFREPLPSFVDVDPDIR